MQCFKHVAKISSMMFKQLPTMISELNKLGIALKALDGMNLTTVGVNTGNLDAFRSAIKGLSTEQAVFALASKGATEEQIRQILITKQSEAADVEAALAKAGLTTATAALNGQEVIELAQRKGLTAERAKEIASNLGLIATEEGQVVSKKQLTVATLKQAGATDAEIASILGLNAAETANIGITNILTGAVAKLWAVITAHPIGAILTAIGAVAVGVIAYINKTNKDAQKAIVETHEKAQQALDDTKTALSDDKSELESVNSELDSTKQKIQDIASQGTITLTEQNELNKLSTANTQLETQKSLLENNIKLKQKSAALDAKNLLGTQVKMDYSDIQDGKDIVSHKESYTYAEHAEYEANSLKNAYNIYMSALRDGDAEKQKIAQELIDAAGGDTAELTSSLLEIVESFKYDDGTIIEGYEDLYNQYMGLIYNLQSLTNPEMFLDIAKQVTEGTNIDYEKAISDGYAMAYDGEFDIDKLNQDFVKALVDNGIDESTIEYIFKLKQQEYQSVVDNINKKYNPDNVLKPNYLTEPGHVDTKEETAQKELDNQNYEQQKQEVQNINDKLTEYAKEHPVEFQLITSYDENFSTLDKYIEEEKSKSESAIQDTKSQLEDLSKNGNVDLTIRPVIDSSAMQAAGWDVEDGSIATTFTQGEFIWQGDEENGQYVYVHYTPILPDGTVLTPDQLSDYLYGTLEGSQNILDADDKGLVLKVDTDLQGISEDDIKALQEDGKQSAKMSNFLNQMGQWDDSLHDVQEGYYLTGNSVDYVDNAVNRLVEDAKKANGEIPNDSFSIPNADTLKQQISDLNSAIDSIQSAYDTLNSAVEEYNTNGGTLSIDTIQSLLSLSDEYLACLQVENGQLSLNADAMAQLAQAKLDEAQATAVTQAMTELDTIAKGENSSANSAYIAGNAALMSSLAQLSGSYDGVAKAAMTAAQAQKLSALISDAAGKDKTATENVMKGLDTKLKLIQTTKASISAGNFGKVAGKSSSSSKGSGSGKSASDTAKEEIEAYMEYLEKALEGGRITYSDYVRDVTLKLDDMYHNGRITAKEYFDYVEKRLNQQLEVYRSVLSAVTDLLEDEAQKWQDKIDALNDENDLLEKQKDDYDSILSAVDQVYQDEIDRLNEQKDLLQDKIDAINDENDALELQRKKQEALIALDKARQQRNVKIYAEGRGYFYDIDQDAYKDAQQNLQDIKNEEVIKKLEDEQDALDDSIELLEKYRDLWNDIADAYKKKTNEALAVALWGENYEKLILQNRTQDIEAFKDKYLEIQSKIDDNKSLIDSYQEKVDYYNKLKEQWNEISSAYEKEQQRMYAAQILGANWEKDVLDGRLDVLNQFRDQYLEIQRQMTQAALDGARARNDAVASETGGSGGSSGGGGSAPSTPAQNQQAYHVLHLVGGYSTSGEASSKISSFNGKGVYKYKDGKWYVYKEEDYSNLSFGSKSEADDYIKKHLSPAGRFLVKYYHNGLENGLVDFNKKDSNFDLVQKYGLKKYEVPAILKQGEAVMNQEQIKNLGEALRSIPTAATLYTTPDYTKMLSSLKTNNNPVMVTQSVNITLPNVTNNSGYENLTRELNRLKLDAYQFANRRN